MPAAKPAYLLTAVRTTNVGVFPAQSNAATCHERVLAVAGTQHRAHAIVESDGSVDELGISPPSPAVSTRGKALGPVVERSAVTGAPPLRSSPGGPGSMFFSRCPIAVS
jgi:hypothetical protein